MVKSWIGGILLPYGIFREKSWTHYSKFFHEKNPLPLQISGSTLDPIHHIFKYNVKSSEIIISTRNQNSMPPTSSTLTNSANLLFLQKVFLFLTTLAWNLVPNISISINFHIQEKFHDVNICKIFEAITQPQTHNSCVWKKEFPSRASRQLSCFPLTHFPVLVSCLKKQKKIILFCLIVTQRKSLALTFQTAKKKKYFARNGNEELKVDRKGFYLFV